MLGRVARGELTVPEASAYEHPAGVWMGAALPNADLPAQF